MINLDEFIKKWTGVGIDVDGAFGFQCVDLYRMYVKECLGIPQTPGVTGAKDIWNNCPGFDKIANTPDGVPQKGDVMIWGASYGPYGHVAVVTEATVNTFKCFSQNDPAGSLPSIKLYKTYTPTIGWLRAKGVTTTDTTQLEKDLAEQRKQVSNLQGQVNGLIVDLKSWETKFNECNTQRIEAGSSSDGFRKQFNDFVAKLASILGTRQEVSEIIASIETCIGYEDKAAQLDRQIELERKEHTVAITDLGKELSSIKAQLVNLEGKYKELKYSSIAPIQTTSLWSIIKSVFGR